MELFHHLWTETQNDAANKIVLLHGMGGTGSLWRPIAVSLEKEMSVLSPDQRGHGKSLVHLPPGSRQKPSYSPKDYGQDLIDTLNTKNFHPTWVVGHSMGVRTAVAAAHIKPDWFKGLILVDLGFSGVAGGGLGENLASFIRVLPSHFTSRDEAKAFMEKNCPDPAIAQYLMAVSTRGPLGELTFPFEHAALIQTIESARDFSVRGWVQGLATQGMPILILRGAKSLVWSHEEFEKERQTFSHFASMTFKEIEGAGHGLPFEQRLVFIETLRNFIAQHSQQLDLSQ